jgi:hypothetical protein
MRPCVPSQAEFSAALLDPTQAAPRGLHTWNGSDPAARFAVYRNNVVVSLVQALADAFPVVQRLVGDEFFAAMAGVFVRAHPPRAPVLSDYGDGFADWIATFEPAAGLPYLADMARLERARVRAYHAADTAAIEADALAACLRAPERLDRVRLDIHPSTTALVCDWAVASLWAAHQHAGDEAIARVALDQAESALVLREGDDVLVLPVGRADAVFVRALQSAQPLAAAVEAAAHAAAVEAAARAAAANTAFDLAATLPLLIRHGCITAWRHSGDSA